MELIHQEKSDAKFMVHFSNKLSLTFGVNYCSYVNIQNAWLKMVYMTMF